jgi:hypothetical protein
VAFTTLRINHGTKIWFPPPDRQIQLLGLVFFYYYERDNAPFLLLLMNLSEFSEQSGDLLS